MSPKESGRVRLQVGAVRISVEVPGQGGRVLESPEMWYSPWKLFSPLEGELLVALLKNGPLKRETLAAAVDRSEDTIKSALAALTSRCVLTVGAEGYTVNFPADRRQELLEYLDKPPA